MDKKPFRQRIKRIRARLRRRYKKSSLKTLPQRAGMFLRQAGGWFSALPGRVKGFLVDGRVAFSPRTLVVGGVVLVLVILIPILAMNTSRNVRPAQAAGTSPDAAPRLTASVLSDGDEPIQEIVLPTPTPSPTPVPSPTPLLLFKGMSNPQLVPRIQERLMELGYMDHDEPTNYFGPNTKEAVELFQRKNELAIDGYVGEETFALLMSDDAKKYSVSVGVTGDDVYALQVRLRELGYINKATSYYGEETQAAVKRFQERNGLSPDGTVGEHTREMLYSEDAKANYLSYGDKSEEIKKYQARLIKLAYLTGEADGTYGSGTKAAVKKFQERNGLIADGFLGPATRNLLMSEKAEANTLTFGSNGRDVTYVQNRLKELGYLSAKATGYYGEATEMAVRTFQLQNGLSADGKVGRVTLNALKSGSAKRYSSSAATPKPGTTGGGTSATPKPGGGSSSPSTGPVTVENFLAIAKTRLGCTYRRGGKGPNTFDCSGFVYWCLNQAGVKQGYMTSKGWRSVTKYQRIRSMSDIRAGDVVVFYGHVGIALSNSQMIDASSTQGVIRTCSLGGAYWKRKFICAYRIF